MTTTEITKTATQFKQFFFNEDRVRDARKATNTSWLSILATITDCKLNDDDEERVINLLRTLQARVTQSHISAIGKAFKVARRAEIIERKPAKIRNNPEKYVLQTRDTAGLKQIAVGETSKALDAIFRYEQIEKKHGTEAVNFNQERDIFEAVCKLIRIYVKPSNNVGHDQFLDICHRAAEHEGLKKEHSRHAAG